MMNDLKADLVLEGGGVKGIGLVGAYCALNDAGYKPQRVAGTSAGAIVGALIAANMSVDRMEKVMREVDYGKFEDKGFLDHLGVVGKGLSVLFEKGIYEGRYLREWLTGLLKELGTITFGDLRIDDPESSLPPDRAYRLVVMASDISRGRLVRLPWDYRNYYLNPDDQPVADAVRASMSIPFFYEPVQLKSKDSNGKEKRSYLVDGGMLSNFPVDVFDRTDGGPPRWPTFGIKLSARPSGTDTERFKIDGVLDLARAMVGTMTNFHDQIHIDDPGVLARTLFVDTLRVKATDFNITRGTQDQLFQNGERAGKKFLSKWNWEDYLQAHRHH